MIASTWIEWDRWSANTTTAARLANSAPIATLIASRGTSASSGPMPTVKSPAAL